MKLSKLDFVHMDHYEVFSVPYERLEWLMYEGLLMVPDSGREFCYTPAHSRKRQNSYSLMYSQFKAVQGMGEAYMYDKEIIPISVYTYETYLDNIHSISIRYIGHSIDDASQGFWLTPLEGININLGYELIAIYLESHPFALSNKDFTSYFKEVCSGKFLVDFDFN